MLLEVSVGEAIDKYIILEIKKENITDLYKKSEILKELNSLQSLTLIIEKYVNYYRYLKHINKEIWDLTNNIKLLHYTDTNYANLANDIFNLNQSRFRIKNIFNLLTASNLTEQKSYNSTKCKIVFTSPISEKISEINYLLTQYDYIYFDMKHEIQLTDIFNSPTIQYCEADIKFTETVILDDYRLNTELKDIYKN